MQVEELYKWFPITGGFFGRTEGYLKAVDGVSFEIQKGETLGLVGESGCGKTTLGKTILKLFQPTKGRIIFDGVDIARLKRGKLKAFRKRMQIVSQDPYASLDPRQTVLSALTEPMRAHHIASSRGESRSFALDLIERVGLNQDHLGRFPHEFSGGQRQRIAIARALSVQPEFIVLDEPTSSLDVSVQAQILSLLRGLRVNLDLTYLFISHNLAVVRQMSQRTAVMYLGRIVELADTQELFNNPKHPYTQALLRSVPIPDPKRAIRIEPVLGDVPDPAHISSGCRFRERCKFATNLCEEKFPPWVEVSPNHWVECHYDIDFSRIEKEAPLATTP